MVVVYLPIFALTGVEGKDVPPDGVHCGRCFGGRNDPVGNLHPAAGGPVHRQSGQRANQIWHRNIAHMTLGCKASL